MTGERLWVKLIPKIIKLLYNLEQREKFNTMFYQICAIDHQLHLLYITKKEKECNKFIVRFHWLYDVSWFQKC